jgi:hypothetical protein
MYTKTAIYKREISVVKLVSIALMMVIFGSFHRAGGLEVASSNLVTQRCLWSERFSARFCAGPLRFFFCPQIQVIVFSIDFDANFVNTISNKTAYRISSAFPTQNN